MKKVWITYILILLGGVLCFQLIPVCTVDEYAINTEQTSNQNNDAEESETRLSLDDEIIAEALLSPYLLPPPKDCFYLLPGRPLPYISISLHFPPPNIA
ncbi:hypothetical protein [Sphingobacterium arenae]|uniref:Uncharacterized protein n=1 Tax=Sphingobacterium arenae TaxID=1280598 RepID=A0ABR7Y289_9SPHI|nr:hypothetical protein [Sphingobacterium arenae]MBD1425412.1 hypothetical protein [Sphingobacterium arenae]